MRLTEHFTTAEFACRDGSPVPRYALDDVRYLCEHFLEPLRAVYGPVTIISGYRTRTWNKRVRGAPASMHIYLRERAGAAADIRCARGAPAGWAAELDRAGATGLGVYADHVHVDTRRGHARW